MKLILSTVYSSFTGNWDLVGNNTPIFFIRDPILFPSFIHTQKRNPVTHLKDPDAMWDFITLRPETTHQVIQRTNVTPYVISNSYIFVQSNLLKIFANLKNHSSRDKNVYDGRSHTQPIPLYALNFSG